MLGCFERNHAMAERMQDGPKSKSAERPAEPKRFGGGTGEAFVVPKLVVGKRMAKGKKKGRAI